MTHGNQPMSTCGSTPLTSPPTIPPSANWTICPECGGNLTPDHRCPPKPAPTPTPSTPAERRAYAARIAAEFAIDAYSLPNLPRSGGVR